MLYEFRVKKSERGRRLDNFLYSKIGTWSHKKIKQAIDSRQVILNGKNVFISGWNLKPGDRIRFCPEETDDSRLKEQSRYHFVHVLYEDPYLLVTDKPPFIDYDSYVSQVSGYLKRINRRDTPVYLGQMHRLDRETSGILVFTKKKVSNVLAEQFRNRQIRKYYLAVVHGRVEKEHGLLEERIEKGKFQGGRKARIVSGRSGKESQTEFWVLERYDEATLLKLRLGTGRTHQIRVHMSQMGHPIVGDKLYGQSLTPQSQSSVIKRQALHANHIEFTHPVTMKKISLSAPLPQDLASLIDRLRLAV